MMANPMLSQIEDFQWKKSTLTLTTLRIYNPLQHLNLTWHHVSLSDSMKALPLISISSFLFSETSVARLNGNKSHKSALIFCFAVLLKRRGAEWRMRKSSSEQSELEGTWRKFSNCHEAWAAFEPEPSQDFTESCAWFYWHRWQKKQSVQVFLCQAAIKKHVRNVKAAILALICDIVTFWAEISRFG